ncbi:hypothetical protein [uncultured Desulfobacter sp.]|uniref:hypothetical protein n=1 Tax=uncultured Desulfobacter sp. TaxID=240139 RepID=UPI002AABB5A1|nr:hypothetical protein [uncultured Desulfobacter sp.]
MALVKHVSNQNREDDSLVVGSLFLDEGLISPKDMERALAVQEKSLRSKSRDNPRFFASILCDLNLVTPVDAYYILRKNKKLRSVQVFLEQEHIVSSEVINQCMIRVRETGIPFISTLLEAGVISEERLSHILMDLFRIPLRSISDLGFNRKDREDLSSLISKDEARLNKTIPLLLQGKTLLIGIMDPENLLFVRWLIQRLPNFRFETLFIPYSGFIWFFKLLYNEAYDSVVPKDISKELSALLSYNIVIRDPVIEQDGVFSFFKQYEKLKNLFSDRCSTQDRHVAFHTFIMEKHRQITTTFHCRAVRFSLEKNQGKVVIAALPEDQEQYLWPK